MKQATSLYVIAVAVLISLLIPRGAFAQEGSPRVTVFGGGSFLKGDRSFVVGGDIKRSNFANGGKVGARGTWDLDSHWALEGAYGYGSNNLRIIDFNGTTTVERGSGTRVHQIIGNALYYLSEPKSKFRPFLTGGGGLMRFNPTSQAKTAAAAKFVDEPATITADNKFEFNFGGGVETEVSKVFGWRLDLRDHLARIPRFGVPQAPTAGVADFFPVSGAVHNVEASVGVVIYLGRR
jgi:outer membrane protein with beta-barrel domain